MSAVDWATLPLVGFDLEATGVDVFEDRIVQAAAVLVRPGQEPRVKTWLADPGIEIPDEAAAVHGITTQRAQAEGRAPGAVLEELLPHLSMPMGKGMPVVVANAPYDFTLLDAECRRHGMATLNGLLSPLPLGPVIDPMVLDRYVDPYRKGICAEARKPCACGAVDKKLTSLCLHYGVELTAAHDAGADALAAALLVPKIIARYSQKFRGFSVGGLHQAQIGWRKSQSDGLRDYWKRTGDERWREVNSDWPIQSAPIPTQPDQQGVLL